MKLDLRRATAFGLSPVLIAALMATITAHPVAASEQPCPPALKQATRLLVATTPAPNAMSGRIRMFARDRVGQPWRVTGNTVPMVTGLKGLAWGWTAARLGHPGEPMKREGDKRTPAGVFALGRPFGTGASKLPDYLRLRRGETFCVDDAQSPHYGRIVPRARAGRGVSGEDMATIKLYRRGVVVNYAPNAAKRAGSCIFLHVWRRSSSGTLGCIAASAGSIRKVQSFVAGETAAIAILPETARSRLGHCLPN